MFVKKSVKSLEKFSLNKIIFLIYFIINLILFIVNEIPAVLGYINYLAIGYGIFCETTIQFLSILCFFAFEIVLIISLFIKKSKFKLIANILFCILCVIDTGMCIFELTEKVNCIVEVILDFVFICLILFNIITSYKKPKNNTETLPQ